MWSVVAGVVLFALIIVMIVWGGSSMVRGMTRGRYNAHGDDIEEMMFRAEHDRRLDRQAGMAVPPRWWQRVGRRSGG